MSAEFTMRTMAKEEPCGDRFAPETTVAMLGLNGDKAANNGRRRDDR
jgi:hypothetical protein